MLLPALLCLATLAPLPIDLDSISIDRARHLSGRVVSASFLSIKPADYRQDRRGRPWTVLGAADRDDDAERGAFVRGTRYDLDGWPRGGKRVRVVGVLRVIDHPAAVVGGVRVPAWVEPRTSRGRAVRSTGRPPSGRTGGPT
jgi:hypothetical protein